MTNNLISCFPKWSDFFWASKRLPKHYCKVGVLGQICSQDQVKTSGIKYKPCL